MLGNTATSTTPLVVARSRRGDSRSPSSPRPVGTNGSASWMSDAATVSSNRLAEFGEVEGVEPDEGLVDPGGPRRNANSDRPFDANFGSQESFDLILMLDVLEYLDDPAEALRSRPPVRSRQRCALAHRPRFQLLWTNHDVINHHRLRYRRATFVPSSIGPASLSSKSAIGIRGHARRSSQFDSSKPFPAVLPRSSRSFGLDQSSLYWISRTEQRTLGAIGTPFGSSLMVYSAKKRRP